MSLGPIRELSAGPKPGRVSTFTKRQRGSKRTNSQDERKGGLGGGNE